MNDVVSLSSNPRRRIGELLLVIRSVKEALAQGDFTAGGIALTSEPVLRDTVFKHLWNPVPEDVDADNGRPGI